MQGYMTYISAGVLLLAALAHQFGWIDDSTFQTIATAAGAGGLTFLRRSVATTAGQNATGNALIANAVGVPPDVVADKIAPPAGSSA